MLWFEAVHDLLTSDLQEGSTTLMALTEEFFDYFLVSSKLGSDVWSCLSVMLVSGELSDPAANQPSGFATHLSQLKRNLLDHLTDGPSSGL